MSNQKKPNEIDVIAELEQENILMRARMERLEAENRVLETHVLNLQMRLLNEENKNDPRNVPARSR